MPFVTVQTVKGVLNEIQKQEILEGISELIVRVAGGADQQKFREAVWVVIDEQEPGNWYLGGKQPTAEMLSYQNKHSENSRPHDFSK